jgi:hypothetical protein
MATDTKAAVTGPTTIPKRQRLNMLKAQLEDQRTLWMGDWRELNDFLMPRRGRFTPGENTRARRLSNKIIDSAASLSLRTLAAGLCSGITSPAREWFRLTTPDPDLAESSAVKEWLHAVTQRLQAIFARSNWYKVLPMLYKDMGAFGTAAMAMMEDPDNVIHCTTFPIGSYALANDARGRVRTFVREFTMTPLQMAEQFGRDKLTTASKTALDNGQALQAVNVVHVVHHNQDYDPSKYDSRRKRFYGCYYEAAAPVTDDGQFLEEKGFDEFPILAPRWEVSGDDVYGSDCPGMMAIGDVKQLQAMKKLMLKGIQKQVDPPMVGPPELQTQRASIISGDITYIQERGTRPSFYPAHDVRLDLGDLREEENEVRQLIRDAFYEPILLMFDQMEGVQPRNEAEINVREQEKLLVFGPMLEQLNEDLLNPAIDRTFAIALRQGHIPPPPPELEGQVLKVEYISIMHSAQKAQGIATIEQFTGFLNVLANGDPQSPVYDKVDRDQLIDEVGDRMSLPPRIIVPDEQVAQVRQARAKAAAAQQQAAAVTQLAPAAKQLSETDTSSKSALTDLLGIPAQ